MIKKKVFIVIISIVVIILIIVPLSNTCRYLVNRNKINAFIQRYESIKTYVGSFPLFMVFSGYATKNPIRFEDKKFYRVELKCSLNPDMTKLKISLLKVESQYPSGEPKNIIVIGKYLAEGNYVTKYLKEGIPEAIFDRIEGNYIENKGK